MLANLRALFGSVVDIILFRRGPEVLPASAALLATVVALNLLVSVVIFALLALPGSIALLGSVVGSVVTLLWFRGALALANKRERFLQLSTAVFAVNMMFVPVLFPLTTALMSYAQKGDADVPPPAALLLIWLFVGIWALVVVVRIVRAAFECPWIVAILLVVGEALVVQVVGTLLFGVPAKVAA